MELEMVLNELSLKTSASDIYTARQLMSGLIATLREAKVSGVKVLRTSDEIHSLELAPNYHIYQWRNDSEVDRDEIRFFKTLATKAPFWTNEFEEFKHEFDLSEVKYQGEIVNSIGFALVIDGLPISLNSDKTRWNCHSLSLEVLRIDDNQEIVSETVEIVHASCPNHIKQHNDWIKNRFRTQIINVEELWDRRVELFPNLEFCDVVYTQIQSLDNGKPILRQILKRLFELEEYCKSWKNGAFDFDALPSKVSPESKSRLKQFNDKLSFKCSDGKKRVFSLHARMTPGAWRIHFCTELGPGKIIIGYIGPKIR